MHIINASMTQLLVQDDKLSFLRPGKVERTTMLKRSRRDLIWLMAHNHHRYYHQSAARSPTGRSARDANARLASALRSPGRLANQQ